MTTTTVTYTPWGWAHDIEELAEGVWRVWTPSHGGLKLSRERWDSLPPALRDAMYAQTFAEEDCEEPIVRTLLGLGDDIEREMALKVAGYFDRYAPALPYLRSCSPGIHYHAVAYWGGHGWRQSSAAGRSRSAGRMGAGHDRDDAAQAPQPSQHDDQAPDGVRKPVRHGVGGRGRRALRGLRLPRQGRQLPARRHRACLPPHISLHLRRGTPLEEVIDQIQGIQEMQPFWNKLGDGGSVAVLGLGDGIAHILKAHLKAREEREAETVQEAAIEMNTAA